MQISEDLWFGELGTDPAEQEAARSLAAMVAEMRGLRPFSPAVQRLLTTVKNVYFSVDEVTKIIEGDAALAARVLRTVNSAALGLRQRCKSVKHAVTLLGARAITQMASSVQLLDHFGGSSEAGATIIAHSSGVAALCRVLGEKLRLPDRDTLFTCGLLHDLGKLLILQVSGDLIVGEQPDPYPALLIEHAGKHDVMHKHERNLFGYDHAVLGAHVLRAWMLPEPVPQVVAWHHQPERAYTESGDVASMVAAVRLADRLAYELPALPDPDPVRLFDLCEDSCSKFLGLDEIAFTRMWPELHEASKVSDLGE
ncbi:MAG: HDOD domain-containing protein [Myxococcales bacterium]|nr:HDOD domain-containing protein [Myxococcales bacterium]